MSFWGTLFGWTKSFFTYVAETIVGQAAESLSDAALDIVQNLESKHDLSGKEKFNQAKDVLAKKYPSVQTAAINLAIESAVAIVKDQME